MKINNIDFYYFSGTGNTLLDVKKMRDIFEEKNVNVTLYPMEKADPNDINLDHIIGLGFPVAEQGTYPFVWDFIKSLPPGKKTPIFMVDTLLTYSGGVVGPIKKIVSMKEYIPIGAKEICMPNNLFPKRLKPEKVEKKIQKGLSNTEKYTQDILNGKSEWKRIPLFSDLMSLFSQREITWRFLRWYYTLKVDTSKCNQCGLCIKLCPIHNIIMHDFPEFQNNCKICMRCISFCPNEAIYTPRKTYERYHVVTAIELLNE